MRISELAVRGVKRMRLPHWAKGVYIELTYLKKDPKTGEFCYGPWAKIVDPHSLKAMGAEVYSKYEYVIILGDIDDRWEPFED